MDFARKPRDVQRAGAFAARATGMGPIMRFVCHSLALWVCLGIIAAVPMAGLVPPAAVRAHEFVTSPFVSEPRAGRFAYLGVITYRCDRGPRQVICSGQGIVVARCLVLTSAHLARDAVDRRARRDGLTKSFVLHGTAFDVVPLEAGTAADGSPIAENAQEDWALMHVTAQDCPGADQRWLPAPTIDPARLPIGTPLAVYSLDDRDPSQLIVSHGAFEGPAPGDVLLMASASMRPGQSGGLVTVTGPDGAMQVIGMVQGAKDRRDRFFRRGLKAFSPEAANLFTNIVPVLAGSPAAELVAKNRD
jgi:hypothetical protein